MAEKRWVYNPHRECEDCGRPISEEDGSLFFREGTEEVCIDHLDPDAPYRLAMENALEERIEREMELVREQRITDFYLDQERAITAGDD